MTCLIAYIVLSGKLFTAVTKLRINAPGSFGSKYLLDVLSQFMHRYPEVKLEVEFNDRLIDVVAAFD